MIPNQSPNHARVLIPIELLDDKNRIREDYSHVTDLATSIRDAGTMLGKAYHLIQPVVITADYKVVDGGSRLRACRDILKLTEIDVVFMETLQEDQLRVLEMEANIQRKDFSWKEKVLGVVRVHEYRARSAALSSDRWTQRQTGELLRMSLGNVNNCISLASYIRLADKEICASENATDAIKVLLQRKEKEVNKLLAASTLSFGTTGSNSTNILDEYLGTPSKPSPSLAPHDPFFSPVPTGPSPICAPSIDEDPLFSPVNGGAPATTVPTIPLSKFLLRGDCIEVLKGFADESIDHCITDIPYGIDMDNLDQSGASISGIATVASEHTVDGNLVLMQAMFPAIFRVLKPASYFVFFYDLDHHEKLQGWARQAGFRVQRWPLVWHKTHTCINMSAQHNFTKNYEVAMVCRKGNATLVTPEGSSVWMGSAEDTKVQLGHPFVKPAKLWSWVMGHVALRGQTILDPFAGVGSSTIAAIYDGYKPIAIELNEDHWNRQVVNVSKVYNTLVPGCQFT